MEYLTEEFKKWIVITVTESLQGRDRTFFFKTLRDVPENVETWILETLSGWASLFMLESHHPMTINNPPEASHELLEYFKEHYKAEIEASALASA